MSQDRSSNKEKGTFGLSLGKVKFLQTPMIVIPSSDKEAARLKSTGMYKKFRTFEAGRAAYENQMKAKLGTKRSKRLERRREGLSESDSESSVSNSSNEVSKKATRKSH